MDTPHAVSMPRTRRRTVMVLVAAVLVALAVTAYLVVALKMPLPGAFGRFVSAFTLPAELRSAALISVSPRGTDVFVHAGTGYRHAAGIEGVVRGLARTERDGYAALTADTEAGSNQILVGESVVAAGPSIRSIASSPDGRRIAYAETADGSAYASDPSGWVLKVYYPDPRTTQTVGPGFAPFFLSDTLLGYFTAAGVFAIDLETGVPIALLREPFPYAHEVALVSPDRTQVAWQAADGRLHSYRRSESGIEPVETFSLVEALPGASAPALGNDGFYTVRATNHGSEVWRRSFDGMLARRAVLPPSLETTRLMFFSN